MCGKTGSPIFLVVNQLGLSLHIPQTVGHLFEPPPQVHRNVAELVYMVQTVSVQYPMPELFNVHLVCISSSKTFDDYT